MTDHKAETSSSSWSLTCERRRYGVQMPQIQAHPCKASQLILLSPHDLHSKRKCLLQCLHSMSASIFLLPQKARLFASLLAGGGGVVLGRMGVEEFFFCFCFFFVLLGPMNLHKRCRAESPPEIPAAQSTTAAPLQPTPILQETNQPPFF